MKLRKVIKRIVALGTGASLVGATFLGAMAAADLKDYPMPFIKDGKFMGTLVIGDGGQTIDVIGATDIAVSLQYSATKKTTTTTGTDTTIEGDAFRISASGDEMNLYEPTASVKDVIDKNGLKALASGSLTNDKGTYSYDQYLHSNVTVEFVKDDQTGGTQDPKLYLRVKNDGNTKVINDGSELIRYKLTFPTALKSDIDSSRDLDDLDNKKLKILGKEYSFINTDFTTGGKLTLELMGGAVIDTLEEGKTKTYTIDGKDYEVTATAITDVSPFQVKFNINTEVTESLQATQTYTLTDGTQIGVKEILPNEAGDVTADIVEFYLGAKKITIADSNSSGGNIAGTFSIGSNDLSDPVADIVWSNTSTPDISISEIDIAWQASDTYYVPSGGKLTDVVKADKDVTDLFTALGIDFQFAGTKSNVVDAIGIHPSGSNNVKLKVKTKSGAQISEDLWFYNSTNAKVMLAKDATKQVIVCENATVDGSGDTACETTFYGAPAGDGGLPFITTVEDEDMFVVETNKYSHLMQLKKFDSTNTKVTLKDVADGQTEDISVGTGGLAKFYKDGYEYQITVNGGYTSAQLTLIAGDSGDAPFPTNSSGNGDIRADLWSEHGAKIRLGQNYTIIVEGQDISRDDSGIGTHNISVLTNIVTGPKISPSTVRTNSPSSADLTTADKDPTISLDSNSNKREGMTQWGTLIKQDTSGDQDTIDLEYPEKEAIANVYVTSGATSSIAGGSSEGVTVQRIEVGAAKLASEVTNLQAQNTLIVGGPCVNKFAEEALGNPADCTQGFEEGKGIIQLWEHTNGNVAILVAGYSGEDTRRTAQVLANYKDYAGQLKGTKVEVTTATKTVKSVST